MQSNAKDISKPTGSCWIIYDYITALFSKRSMEKARQIAPKTDTFLR